MSHQITKALIAIALALVALPAVAATVTLAWDRNPEPEVTSYKLYWGRASRTYTNVVNVGNVTTYTVTNLPSAATHYFALVAVTTNGLESDFSAEVSTTILPLPPRNFRYITNTLQGATSLDGPWTNLAQSTFRLYFTDQMAEMRAVVNWGPEE
jgi:hypothetical protein